MRNIPIALLDHYKSGALTVAKLWKVTRVDGQVFGFCDVDTDIEYLGTTYKGSTGFIPSAIQTANSFGVDNLDVQAVLNDETITEKDLKLGLWDGARIDLMEVNYMDLSMGHVFIRTGYLGEVKNGRLTFYGELRGLTQRLQTQVGRIYNPACDADLGDHRCRVDLAPLRVNLTIQTPSTSSIFFVDPASVSSLPDGRFVNGLIEVTSGLNAGFKAEVNAFTKANGRFRLFVPAPYDFAPGDGLIATPGCTKSEAACKAFDNYLNFRGIPDIPGPDKLTSGK